MEHSQQTPQSFPPPAKNDSTKLGAVDDEGLSLLVEVFKPRQVNRNTEEDDTASVEGEVKYSLGSDTSTEIQSNLLSAPKDREHFGKMNGGNTQGPGETSVLSSYAGFCGMPLSNGALWSTGSIWSVPESITTYHPPRRTTQPPKMAPRVARNTCAVLFWGW